jgi:hypothetical protein
MPEETDKLLLEAIKGSGTSRLMLFIVGIIFGAGILFATFSSGYTRAEGRALEERVTATEKSMDRLSGRIDHLIDNVSETNKNLFALTQVLATRQGIRLPNEK